jgi:hypothetical protein
MPLLADDFYSDDYYNCYSLLANYLSNLAVTNNPMIFNQTWLNNFVNSNSDINYPIVNITYYNDLYYNSTNFTQSFRGSELQYAISNNSDFAITYSVYIDTSTSGTLSIIKTLYVCMLLTLAAITFENDAKVLILQPLEVMVEIIERVARDPISAKNTSAIQQLSLDARDLKKKS